MGRTSPSATTRPKTDASRTAAPTSRSSRTTDTSGAQDMSRVGALKLWTACAALALPAAAHAATAPKKPKLVVVVVIDQLRAADLQRLNPHLSGGFERL